jgi:hypothetical protein
LEQYLSLSILHDLRLLGRENLLRGFRARAEQRRYIAKIVARRRV